MYHLDANMISAMMREPSGRVGARARRFAFGQLAASVIVLAELRFGIAKKASAQLADQLDRLLEGILIEPVDEAVADEYARVRLGLERLGNPIGSNDTWIAAHALALGATLVTANEREFRRVLGLKVENWAA